MEGVTLLVGAVTAAIGLWFLARRSYRAALFLAGGIAGAVGLSTVAKGIVARPPIEGPADEYSFPSGSATWSAATAAALVLLARSRRERRLATSAGAVLVLGLGAVIVWEEWHYPSDVLAGWTLAGGWVASLWLVLRCPKGPVTGTARLTPPVAPSDTRVEKEEQTAAAPSVPAAKRSGGTDTTA